MGWLREIVRRLGQWVQLSDPPPEGRCGAIALWFACKRLGKKASLEEIWKAVKAPHEIAGPGRFGSSGHLMCREALNRGLQAMHLNLKYEQGLAVMAEARKRKVEVIVSHATPDPAWHHCSVIEGFEGGTVDVFDPTKGALTSLSREDLLELWGRFGDDGGGHYLLAVSKTPAGPAECEACGTPIPREILCPDPMCRKSIPVGPGFLLGCVNKECPAATWESVSCPYCGTEIEDLRSWSAW